MRTVILGGGISGLSAAYALQQSASGTCCIYEKDATVGGLCRTMKVDGFEFDTVSHVLHFRSRETETLVRELLGGDLIRRERSAAIYFQGRYVPYPFQTHLGALPLGAQSACLAGFLKVWLRQRVGQEKQPENFAEWVEQYFGRGIARHFMRPYNQKLWGVPPEEMSLDWIRPFVPQTDLKQVVSNLISRKNHNHVGYNSCFFYPVRGGIQSLCEAFRSRLQEVHLDREAVEIDLDRRTIRFQDGSWANYDCLISTIPLPILIERARGVPEDLRREVEGLRGTTLLNLTYCLRRPLAKPYHWVYFPEAEFPFFRLVFPSNISEDLAPKSGGLIAAEISNPPKGREDELEREVQACLLRLGWIAQSGDVVRVVSNSFRYAYPVHDLERGRRVARLQDFLASRHVWSMGRFGAWCYSSIDDAITEALDTVPRILASFANADSASYIT